MTQHQLYELAVAILTAVATVLLIQFFRKFAKIPTDGIGLDLNLLTYGFLWDTVLNATEGKYWDKFPEGSKEFKPLLLIAIVFANLLLTLQNMRLTYEIEGLSESIEKKKKKFRSYYMGIVSLIIFLILKVFLS